MVKRKSGINIKPNTGKDTTADGDDIEITDYQSAKSWQNSVRQSLQQDMGQLWDPNNFDPKTKLGVALLGSACEGWPIGQMLIVIGLWYLFYQQAPTDALPLVNLFGGVALVGVIWFRHSVFATQLQEIAG
jgi:hypothetical protein